MVVTAVYSVELCNDQLRVLECVIGDRSEVEVRVCRSRDGGIFAYSHADLSRTELDKVFEDGLEHLHDHEYLGKKPLDD